MNNKIESKIGALALPMSSPPILAKGSTFTVTLNGQKTVARAPPQGGLSFSHKPFRTIAARGH
jgi:hypothetical protein